MTDMNIVSLETQNGGRDWPLIVMAVQCPKCQAAIGDYCTSVRSEEAQMNPMLHAPGSLRIDWHAERKYEAARLWYAQKDVQQAAQAEEHEQQRVSGDQPVPESNREDSGESAAQSVDSGGAPEVGENQESSHGVEATNPVVTKPKRGKKHG